MITILDFGLCILAALFALATCIVTAIAVKFREPGLLVLAAIFGVLTALLIASAVKLS